MWRRTAPFTALVAVCGLGASGLGACAPGRSPEDSVASTTAVVAPAHKAQRTGAVIPEPPSRIRLPDGIALPVRAVSTTANGVLDVPADLRAAGWWNGGSLLGDPFGSTLIAGHVDSLTQGLGPFATLLATRRGDRFVLRSNQLRQTFRAVSLELVPRDSFGQRSQLYSPSGPRRLTLVTCAGPYDPARGGYQNLAVVVARPVGGPHLRRDP